MSLRRLQKRRMDVYSVGDMRNPILIHTRVMSAPGINSVSISHGYDAGVLAWAMVDTVKTGPQMFTDVNLGEVPTHYFIIRYRSGITSENIVAWQGSFYEIVKPENISMRNKWLRLICKLRGDQNVKVNQ